jgi:hypothetical protein
MNSQEAAEKLSRMMSKDLRGWLEDWQEITDKTHIMNLGQLIHR